MNADSTTIPAGFDPATTLHGLTVRRLQHDYSYNAAVTPANRKTVRRLQADDSKRAALVDSVMAKLRRSNDFR